MSLFGLFDIGRSAIFASQTALSVVSNNIANVNTPGYSRQEAILEIANPVEYQGNFIGRGVGNVEIMRHYDHFTHLQIIGQKHSFGRSYSLDQGLSHVEQIFNEAQELGLLNPLEEYFNAWQEVATNPEGVAQRTALLTKAEALVRSAKQMESDLLNTIKFINDEIVDVVSQVNSLASNIAELNQKVTQVEAGGDTNKASYFRDQRDLMLNQLAEFIDFNWYEDSNGSVTVLMRGKALVADLQTFQLTTAVNTEGDVDVIYNGAVINSHFQQGQIGGYLAVRDDIRANPLLSLRKLVASVTKETNILHRSGYGLDSSTNNPFFNAMQISTIDNSSGANISSAVITTPSSLTLDEYDINFTTATDYEVVNRQSGAIVASGTYSDPTTIAFDGISVTISGAPAAGDSFFVSPLEDAIENFDVAISDIQQIAAASSTLDLPGDNTNALQIAQLSRTDISDLGNVTYEGYYRGTVASVGIMTQAASDSLTYDDNLLFELEKKREEVAGVSLDEEATNLIRYQRAFEAGARILKVTDELLEVIINL